jgi:hypothetical protein
MTRNERRARLIAAIARRTGEALTLEAYTPGDWRGTRYRLAVGTDRGGLSTARYGNRWYNAGWRGTRTGDHGARGVCRVDRYRTSDRDHQPDRGRWARITRGGERVRVRGVFGWRWFLGPLTVTWWVRRWPFEPGVMRGRDVTTWSAGRLSLGWVAPEGA